ncbi:MAG: hypothetical protein US89_C0012G0025 [Candidatus Peregrinibacteria bacterium GW2011_GWF2_38_29]|nr:MAG: hypothetical protein US89_C0012G0025 [Candidatus Peregrinibacteria bacterium GW2011_GWF2_38_29]HBB02471.1 hypothetical protein [Candidatus Peregrinibacteria bacterium]
MPKRDIFLYVNDIYCSCNKILKYTKGCNFAKFKKDEMIIDAVVRNLEIIGEAAKNAPSKLKESHKEIPWKQIIGMRNKVTHEYFGIDSEILWEAIREDIPALKEKIAKIKKTFKRQVLF